MRTNGVSSQPSVRALERGLDVLDCFRRAGPALPLTAVAEAVGLSPSTASRILSTLEKRNYVVREKDTKFYSLGASALSLGGLNSTEKLAMLSMRFLQELNERFGESACVYVPAVDRRVCIQRVESSHPLRPVVNIGDTLPLNLGAAGKLLSAWLTLSPRYDVSRQAPALSPALLAKIREQGYAVSFNERIEGVYAVAAPVFDAAGVILAALSLSGPTARFEADKLPEIVAAVREHARRISELMGWEK
jgi:DNA-binding IclR family transcriptional regulator